MIIVIWILFALLPFVLGLGVQSFIGMFGKKQNQKRFFFSDAWLLGGMLCIVAGQISHLAVFSTGKTLVDAQKIFWALLCGGSVLALVFVFLGWNRRKLFSEIKVADSDRSRLLGGIFLAILLLEIAFIFCIEPIIVPGDMMAETVKSFLSQNAIYKVNPVTGQEYTIGLSERICLLSLPTDYAIICLTFGQEVGFLLHHVMPIVVLLGSMMAYYRLSRRLFGERGKWNYLFLIFVLLVYLFGENAEYLSGYNALHSGYLGSSVRNLVLVPLTISLMLDLLNFEKETKEIAAGEDLEKGAKKADRTYRAWLLVMLVGCFWTECFISVTFLGVGYCFLISVVMVLTYLCGQHISKQRYGKTPWNVNTGKAPWEVEK